MSRQPAHGPDAAGPCPCTGPSHEPHQDGDRLVGRAEAAVRLSGTDPRRALSEARAVLELTRRAEPAGPYGEAASVALRASALAARELGDLELAEERLREAIGAAREHPRRVAQARMSLVTVRAQLGDPEGGLRLAGLAERHLTGTDLARLDVQRSVALMLLGRHAEAVRHCDRAIGPLDEDPRFQAGALLNRGLAHAYLERYGRAEADLARCARIARFAGLDHLVMLAEGNLPFVAARRGDIAAAFTRYRAAEETLFGFPERLAAMRTDFAEALVAARLPGEARALLEQAVPELVAAQAHAAIPQARLSLAQTALLSGDARLAGATARTAYAELAAQGRTAWLPLATEVVLRARLADTADHPQDGFTGPAAGSAPGAPETPSALEASGSLEAPRSPDARGEDLITELVACADELAACGWSAASSALRLTAAASAVRLGALGRAREQLRIAAATATRPLVRWHAVALRHHLDGDLAQALAAAARGIEATHPQCVADDETRGDTVPQASTGRTGGGAASEDVHAPERDAELRAHAARPAEDLASFGLEIAIDHARRTGDAWAVLEWSERWRAVVRGAPPPFPPLENRRLPVPLPGDRLAGAGLLVELVRRGDELFAVTADAGGCALRTLGSYQAAVEATKRIRYGLRRRVLRDAGHPAGADDEAVARELSALDRRLLSGPGTLASPGSPGQGAAGPVTIVPTGALGTLPWPLLPSLRGRPVSVAADAARWFAPPPAPPGGDPLVMSVAGPGLDHAAAEAAMVAAAHRRARRVGASRAEVLRALEQADVLHVAAHGLFSPRGPMLSHITLDDGPLMAYDLLTARRMPRLVVLSACDAGMAHAPVDGAALGLAGTFLDRGAACVVAGVVPVRDDEAPALMTLLHTLLADGRSPAEALALASEKTAVPGFVCFGDGRLPAE
ncbi:CHAT domain-containing protein [Microbispora amethystogenes]|uniref:CHAT domain-containing protein n=1 Tax=Microbispora amethystogenes TaxID=1427754 RepID=A0ABQ4FAR1_9ACTN|nr:CHAT domain-containing protein [Microbispora amethystogenes]GIH31909.1 CHAT domain-containing protein [Microbispora amethystogenes]